MFRVMEVIHLKTDRIDTDNINSFSVPVEVTREFIRITGGIVGFEEGRLGKIFFLSDSSQVDTCVTDLCIYSCENETFVS